MASEDRGEGRDDGADVIALPRRDEEPGHRLGLREVIGDVLREERHRQGRTLADVADEAAVSIQYLSEVERGRKDVSSDLLDAMHRALDLELPEVLERATRRLRLRPSRHDGGPRMLAA